MKYSLNLTLLLMITFFSINAQKNDIYILIKESDKSVIRIKEKTSNDFNIKVLKKNENKFYKNKEVNKNIVIIDKQPQITNFYEFHSYEKPIIKKDINGIVLYSIEDLRVNEKLLDKIANNYRTNIFFLIKKKCFYNAWKTKIVYLE